MPEIEHIAVTTDQNNLPVILAIARPGKDDSQFSPAVWVNRESHDAAGAWSHTWQSLGAPGGEHQLDGIAAACGVGGTPEVAVLTQNRTIWHARQDTADGAWTGWESLGNPVSGGTITPPALAQNQDGRLELFTVAFLPRPSVWHRSQPHVGQNQWGGWSSMGFPAGLSQIELTSVAPAVAQNQDGRLEVYLLISGKIWHSVQKSAGSGQWTPWTSLGAPDDRGRVGVPTAALDVDGRLQVFAASGAEVWVRTQHAPGQGPWESWMSLNRPGLEGEADLAVAAQEGGRLVLFTLRTMPDGTQSLDKLEQQGGPQELWLAGDPFDTDALGKPDWVPAAANPALVLDGGARLRLFMSVTGRTSIYALDQADQGGGQWLEAFYNFQAP